MRVGDLNSGAAKLSLAHRALMLRWEAAKEQWNDAASRTFERERLADIEPHVSQVLEATKRLAEVLEKAQYECGRD